MPSVELTEAGVRLTFHQGATDLLPWKDVADVSAYAIDLPEGGVVRYLSFGTFSGTVVEVSDTEAGWSQALEQLPDFLRGVPDEIAQVSSMTADTPAILLFSR